MTQKGSEEMLVYVGTYTRGESKGIYVYRFDASTGELAPLSVAEAKNPSFLTLHPNKRFLYAVNEVGEPGGGVSAFAIAPETGNLTFLNHQPSQGTAPCHVNVDDAGAFVYAANYGSGTVSVYPIREDGGLDEASDVVRHEGAGPDARRQRGPHAHSINLSPDNHFAFVADLGIDKLMLYDVQTRPGELMPHAQVTIAPGAGPRHFTFHPNGRYAYLINEMGNTIMVFTYVAAQGTLVAIQTVPTLPVDFAGKSTTADIHVAPSGRFLYGSNRGHDSLVIYAIDEATGKLAFVGHEPTRGQAPRNFALDPTGTFLLAANQDGNNIVIFRVNVETGLLTPTGQDVNVSMPVCVKFLAK